MGNTLYGMKTKHTYSVRTKEYIGEKIIKTWRTRLAEWLLKNDIKEIQKQVEKRAVGYDRDTRFRVNLSRILDNFARFELSHLKSRNGLRYYSKYDAIIKLEKLFLDTPKKDIKSQLKKGKE